MSTARYAGVGFLLGLTWGVAARVWMRLNSTDPSFSWLGTMTILGSTAVAGTALGVVVSARRHRRSRRWQLVGVVAALPFCIGAGVSLLPAFLVGGWGLRRGKVARLIGSVSLVLPAVAVLADSWYYAESALLPYPGPWFLALAASGLGVLSITAALAGAVAWGPWPADAPLDHRVEAQAASV